MGGGGFLDPEPYVRKVKNGGMLNSTLKSICSAEDMRTQGVKAELQSRIVDSRLLASLRSRSRIRAASCYSLPALP